MIHNLTPWIDPIVKINPYTPLATAISAIFIGALLSLLVVKEFIRALDRPGKDQWMRTLDLAIYPLMLIFGLILLWRFIMLRLAP